MKEEIKVYLARLFFVLFVVKILALLIAKGFVMINVEKLVEKLDK